MRLIDTAARALRNLRESRARTVLTCLAIAVGAFALTISFSIDAGVRGYTASLIERTVDTTAIAFGKDDAVFSYAVDDTPREYKADDYQDDQGMTYGRLNDADFEKVAKIDGVEGVRKLEYAYAEYVQGVNGKRYAAQADGMNPNIVIPVVAGSAPEKGVSLADDEVIVPERFVRVLGYESNEAVVGQMLTMRYERPSRATPAELRKAFVAGDEKALRALQEPERLDVAMRVVAVSKEPESDFEVRRTFLISDALNSRVARFQHEGTKNEGAYLYGEAKVMPGKDIGEVKAALTAAGYASRTPEEQADMFFEIADVIQIATMALGLITLITAIFGIINTQYISVLERTQQIGLMKALGMRGRDVARLFRIEAALIGLLGGALGVLAGWVTGMVLNPYTEQISGVSSSTMTLFVFELLPATGVIVGLAVVAIVAGYLPARKAARLDPIEALRTE